jgi:DNA-directed RNA polymerase specialized sigma24 family protein/ribosome-associated translation inhibitor RaiA
MNVHISFKAAKHPTVESEIDSQLEKLQRRVQVFRPDLVHLKCVVDHGAGIEGIVVTLNLRLPTGQMAARGTNLKAIGAVKAAFDELCHQFNRHKEILRDFRRNRREKGSNGRQIPFEHTLAVRHLPEVSAEDISLYINTSLPRLRQFVERELAFRETEGRLAGDPIAVEEVLDEAVLAALSDGHQRPEKLAIEPWLYGLTLRAIDTLTATDGAAAVADDDLVHLERSARIPNVLSAESQLQFHQPDELLQEEDVVADRRAATPEESCSSREWLALTEAAMRNLPRSEREAFLLVSVEGFTVDEAASITGRNRDDIRESAAEARGRLKKLVPSTILYRHRGPQSARSAS